LIELQPSQDVSAPLKCSLLHTRLPLCDNRDIFGHYIALSYVWGNPEKSRTLFVDGKRLDITANLCSALLDLRDGERSFLLWADGVCINQGDDDEKANQIGLMGRIYAGAQHTIIYLGPATSTDPESICLTAVRDGARQEQHHRQLDLDPILRKEWFTRVWVFQELVFSTSPWLQCGRMRIKWGTLFHTLGLEFFPMPERHINLRGQAMPHSLPKDLDEKYRIIVELERARSYHHYSKLDQFKPSAVDLGPPNSMTTLLLARRGFGVTDPR
jgi:hypothetical protein